MRGQPSGRVNELIWRHGIEDGGGRIGPGRGLGAVGAVIDVGWTLSATRRGVSTEVKRRS